MLDMYGDVILTRDVTEHVQRAGDVGTVVERHILTGVAEASLRGMTPACPRIIRLPG